MNVLIYIFLLEDNGVILKNENVYVLNILFMGLSLFFDYYVRCNLLVWCLLKIDVYGIY